MQAGQTAGIIEISLWLVRVFFNVSGPWSILRHIRPLYSAGVRDRVCAVSVAVLAGGEVNIPLPTRTQHCQYTAVYCTLVHLSWSLLEFSAAPQLKDN